MTKRPWDPFYGDMPSEIEYPDLTLFESLAETARENPRRSVYDFLGHHRSYRSFLAEVRRVAAGLWDIGVRPGDRLCCILPNCPHVLILSYAANRIGAVLAVFDADAGTRDIRDLLDDLRPKWAVVIDEHLTGFQRASAGIGIRGIVAARITDYASASRNRTLRRLQKRDRTHSAGLRGPVFPIAAGEPATSEAELPPAFSWATVRRLGIRSPIRNEVRDLHSPDEPAVVLYTSGATGKPCGVVLSDRNLDASARQMQVQGPIIPGQRILSVVPFSHGFGFAVSIHTSVVGGAETVIAPHSSPRLIARTIRRRRPDYLIGVPSFYASLVSDRRFRRTRLSFLMGAFVGGDRVSSNLLDAFEMTVRRRGGAVGLREGYGLTETVAACVVTPDAVRRNGSVGIPAPDMDLRIIDADSDVPVNLEPGEVGEICVCGPTVMLGYNKRPGAAQVFEQDGRRWLRTGDLGHVDEDGFVYYLDRKSSRVDSGSGPLYPGRIEGTLNSHPEVKEVCVTVVQSAHGPIVTAHVVPSDRDLEPEWIEGTLREWCRQNLTEPYQPTRFVFANALPHTRVGVVDYRRIVAAAQV